MSLSSVPNDCFTNVLVKQLHYISKSTVVHHSCKVHRPLHPNNSNPFPSSMYPSTVQISERRLDGTHGYLYFSPTYKSKTIQTRFVLSDVSSARSVREGIYSKRVRALLLYSRASCRSESHGSTRAAAWRTVIAACHARRSSGRTRCPSRERPRARAWGGSRRAL